MNVLLAHLLLLTLVVVQALAQPCSGGGKTEKKKRTFIQTNTKPHSDGCHHGKEHSKTENKATSCSESHNHRTRSKSEGFYNHGCDDSHEVNRRNGRSRRQVNHYTGDTAVRHGPRRTHDQRVNSYGHSEGPLGHGAGLKRTSNHGGARSNNHGDDTIVAYGKDKQAENYVNHQASEDALVDNDKKIINDRVGHPSVTTDNDDDEMSRLRSPGAESTNFTPQSSQTLGMTTMSGSDRYITQTEDVSNTEVSKSIEKPRGKSYTENDEDQFYESSVYENVGERVDETILTIHIIIDNNDEINQASSNVYDDYCDESYTDTASFNDYSEATKDDNFELSQVEKSDIKPIEDNQSASQIANASASAFAEETNNDNSNTDYAIGDAKNSGKTTGASSNLKQPITKETNTPTYSHGNIGTSDIGFRYATADAATQTGSTESAAVGTAQSVIFDGNQSNQYKGQANTDMKYGNGDQNDSKGGTSEFQSKDSQAPSAGDTKIPNDNTKLSAASATANAATKDGNTKNTASGTAQSLTGNQSNQNKGQPNTDMKYGNGDQNDSDGGNNGFYSKDNKEINSGDTSRNPSDNSNFSSAFATAYAATKNGNTESTAVGTAQSNQYKGQPNTDEKYGYGDQNDSDGGTNEFQSKDSQAPGAGDTKIPNYNTNFSSASATANAATKDGNTKNTASGTAQSLTGNQSNQNKGQPNTNEKYGYGDQNNSNGGTNGFYSKDNKEINSGDTSRNPSDNSNISSAFATANAATKDGNTKNTASGTAQSLTGNQSNQNKGQPNSDMKYGNGDQNDSDGGTNGFYSKDNKEINSGDTSRNPSDNSNFSSAFATAYAATKNGNTESTAVGTAQSNQYKGQPNTDEKYGYGDQNDSDGGPNEFQSKDSQAPGAGDTKIPNYNTNFSSASATANAATKDGNTKNTASGTAQSLTGNQSNQNKGQPNTNEKYGYGDQNNSNGGTNGFYSKDNKEINSGDTSRNPSDNSNISSAFATANAATKDGNTKNTASGTAQSLTGNQSNQNKGQPNTDMKYGNGDQNDSDGGTNGFYSKDNKEINSGDTSRNPSDNSNFSSAFATAYAATKNGNTESTASGTAQSVTFDGNQSNQYKGQPNTGEKYGYGDQNDSDVGTNEFQSQDSQAPGAGYTKIPNYNTNFSSASATANAATKDGNTKNTASGTAQSLTGNQSNQNKGQPNTGEKYGYGDQNDSDGGTNGFYSKDNKEINSGDTSRNPSDNSNFSSAFATAYAATKNGNTESTAVGTAQSNQYKGQPNTDEKYGYGDQNDSDGETNEFQSKDSQAPGAGDTKIPNYNTNFSSASATANAATKDGNTKNNASGTAQSLTGNQSNQNKGQPNTNEKYGYGDQNNSNGGTNGFYSKDNKEINSGDTSRNPSDNSNISSAFATAYAATKDGNTKNTASGTAQSLTGNQSNQNKGQPNTDMKYGNGDQNDSDGGTNGFYSKDNKEINSGDTSRNPSDNSNFSSAFANAYAATKNGNTESTASGTAQSVTFDGNQSNQYKGQPNTGEKYGYGDQNDSDVGTNEFQSQDSQAPGAGYTKIPNYNTNFSSASATANAATKDGNTKNTASGTAQSLTGNQSNQNKGQPNTGEKYGYGDQNDSDGGTNGFYSKDNKEINSGDTSRNPPDNSNFSSAFATAYAATKNGNTESTASGTAQSNQYKGQPNTDEKYGYGDQNNSDGGTNGFYSKDNKEIISGDTSRNPSDNSNFSSAFATAYAATKNGNTESTAVGTAQSNQYKGQPNTDEKYGYGDQNDSDGGTNEFQSKDSQAPGAGDTKIPNYNTNFSSASATATAATKDGNTKNNASGTAQSLTGNQSNQNKGQPNTNEKYGYGDQNNSNGGTNGFYSKDNKEINSGDTSRNPSDNSNISSAFATANAATKDGSTKNTASGTAQSLTGNQSNQNKGQPNTDMKYGNGDQNDSDGGTNGFYSKDNKEINSGDTSRNPSDNSNFSSAFATAYAATKNGNTESTAVGTAQSNQYKGQPNTDEKYGYGDQNDSDGGTNEFQSKDSQAPGAGDTKIPNDNTNFSSASATANAATKNGNTESTASGTAQSVTFDGNQSNQYKGQPNTDEIYGYGDQNDSDGGTNEFQSKDSQAPGAGYTKIPNDNTNFSSASATANAATKDGNTKNTASGTAQSLTGNKSNQNKGQPNTGEKYGYGDQNDSDGGTNGFYSKDNKEINSGDTSRNPSDNSNFSSAFATAYAATKNGNTESTASGTAQSVTFDGNQSNQYKGQPNTGEKYGYGDQNDSDVGNNEFQSQDSQAPGAGYTKIPNYNTNFSSASATANAATKDGNTKNNASGTAQSLTGNQSNQNKGQPNTGEKYGYGDQNDSDGGTNGFYSKDNKEINSGDTSRNPSDNSNFSSAFATAYAATKNGNTESTAVGTAQSNQYKGQPNTDEKYGYGDQNDSDGGTNEFQSKDSQAPGAGDTKIPNYNTNFSSASATATAATKDGNTKNNASGTAQSLTGNQSNQNKGQPNTNEKYGYGDQNNSNGGTNGFYSKDNKEINSGDTSRNPSDNSNISSAFATAYAATKDGNTKNTASGTAQSLTGNQSNQNKGQPNTDMKYGNGDQNDSDGGTNGFYSKDNKEINSGDTSRNPSDNSNFSSAFATAYAATKNGNTESTASGTAQSVTFDGNQSNQYKGQPNTGEKYGYGDQNDSDVGTNEFQSQDSQAPGAGYTKIPNYNTNFSSASATANAATKDGNTKNTASGTAQSLTGNQSNQNKGQPNTGEKYGYGDQNDSDGGTNGFYSKDNKEINSGDTSRNPSDNSNISSAFATANAATKDGNTKNTASGTAQSLTGNQSNQNKGQPNTDMKYGYGDQNDSDGGTNGFYSKDNKEINSGDTSRNPSDNSNFSSAFATAYAATKNGNTESTAVGTAQSNQYKGQPNTDEKYGYGDQNDSDGGSNEFQSKDSQAPGAGDTKIPNDNTNFSSASATANAATKNGNTESTASGTAQSVTFDGNQSNQYKGQPNTDEIYGYGDQNDSDGGTNEFQSKDSQAPGAGYTKIPNDNTNFSSASASANAATKDGNTKYTASGTAQSLTGNQSNQNKGQPNTGEKYGYGDQNDSDGGTNGFYSKDNKEINSGDTSRNPSYNSNISSAFATANAATKDGNTKNTASGTAQSLTGNQSNQNKGQPNTDMKYGYGDQNDSDGGTNGFYSKDNKEINSGDTSRNPSDNSNISSAFATANAATKDGNTKNTASGTAQSLTGNQSNQNKGQPNTDMKYGNGDQNDSDGGTNGFYSKDNKEINSGDTSRNPSDNSNFSSAFATAYAATKNGNTESTAVGTAQSNQYKGQPNTDEKYGYGDQNDSDGGTNEFQSKDSQAPGAGDTKIPNDNTNFSSASATANATTKNGNTESTASGTAQSVTFDGNQSNQYKGQPYTDEIYGYGDQNDSDGVTNEFQSKDSQAPGAGYTKIPNDNTNFSSASATANAASKDGNTKNTASGTAQSLTGNQSNQNKGQPNTGEKYGYGDQNDSDGGTNGFYSKDNKEINSGDTSRNPSDNSNFSSAFATAYAATKNGNTESTASGTAQSNQYKGQPNTDEKYGYGDQNNSDGGTNEFQSKDSQAPGAGYTKIPNDNTNFSSASATANAATKDGNTKNTASGTAQSLTGNQSNQNKGQPNTDMKYGYGDQNDSDGGTNGFYSKDNKEINSGDTSRNPSDNSNISSAFATANAATKDGNTKNTASGTAQSLTGNQSNQNKGQPNTDMKYGYGDQNDSDGGTNGFYSKDNKEINSGDTSRNPSDNSNFSSAFATAYAATKNGNTESTAVGTAQSNQYKGQPNTDEKYGYGDQNDFDGGTNEFQSKDSQAPGAGDTKIPNYNTNFSSASASANAATKDSNTKNTASGTAQSLTGNQSNQSKGQPNTDMKYGNGDQNDSDGGTNGFYSKDNKEINSGDTSRNPSDNSNISSAFATANAATKGGNTKNTASGTAQSLTGNQSNQNKGQPNTNEKYGYGDQNNSDGGTNGFYSKDNKEINSGDTSRNPSDNSNFSSAFATAYAATKNGNTESTAVGTAQSNQYKRQPKTDEKYGYGDQNDSDGGISEFQSKDSQAPGAGDTKIPNDNTNFSSASATANAATKDSNTKNTASGTAQSLTGNQSNQSKGQPNTDMKYGNGDQNDSDGGTNGIYSKDNKEINSGDTSRNPSDNSNFSSAFATAYAATKNGNTESTAVGTAQSNQYKGQPNTDEKYGYGDQNDSDGGSNEFQSKDSQAPGAGDTKIPNDNTNFSSASATANAATKNGNTESTASGTAQSVTFDGNQSNQYKGQPNTDEIYGYGDQNDSDGGTNEFQSKDSQAPGAGYTKIPNDNTNFSSASATANAATKDGNTKNTASGTAQSLTGNQSNQNKGQPNTGEKYGYGDQNDSDGGTNGFYSKDNKEINSGDTSRNPSDNSNISSAFATANAATKDGNTKNTASGTAQSLTGNQSNQNKGQPNTDMKYGYGDQNDSDGGTNGFYSKDNKEINSGDTSRNPSDNSNISSAFATANAATKDGNTKNTASGTAQSLTGNQSNQNKGQPNTDMKYGNGDQNDSDGGTNGFYSKDNKEINSGDTSRNPSDNSNFSSAFATAYAATKNGNTESTAVGTAQSNQYKGQPNTDEKYGYGDQNDFDGGTNEFQSKDSQAPGAGDTKIPNYNTNFSSASASANAATKDGNTKNTASGTAQSLTGNQSNQNKGQPNTNEKYGYGDQNNSDGGTNGFYSKDNKEINSGDTSRNPSDNSNFSSAFATAYAATKNGNTESTAVGTAQSNQYKGHPNTDEKYGYGDQNDSDGGPNEFQSKDSQAPGAGDTKIPNYNTNFSSASATANAATKDGNTKNTTSGTAQSLTGNQSNQNKGQPNTNEKYGYGDQNDSDGGTNGFYSKDNKEINSGDTSRNPSDNSNFSSAFATAYAATKNGNTESAAVGTAQSVTFDGNQSNQYKGQPNTDMKYGNGDQNDSDGGTNGFYSKDNKEINSRDTSRNPSHNSKFSDKGQLNTDKQYGNKDQNNSNGRTIYQQRLKGQQFINSLQGGKSDKASGTRDSGIYPNQMEQPRRRTTQDKRPDVPTSRDGNASVPKAVEQKTSGIDQQRFEGQQFIRNHQGGKYGGASGSRNSGIYPNEMEQQRTYATQYDVPKVPTGRDESASVPKAVEQKRSGINQQNFGGQHLIRNHQGGKSDGANSSRNSGIYPNEMEQQQRHATQQNLPKVPAGSYDSVSAPKKVDNNGSTTDQQSGSAVKQVEDNRSAINQQSLEGRQFISSNQGGKCDEASGTKCSGIYPNEMGERRRHSTQQNIPEVPAGSYDSVSAAKQVEDKRSGINQQNFGGQHLIRNHQGRKSDGANGSRNSGIYPNEMEQQQRHATQHNLPKVPAGSYDSVSAPKKVDNNGSTIDQQSGSAVKQVEDNRSAINQQSLEGRHFISSNQGGKCDEASGTKCSGIYPNEMAERRRHSTQQNIPEVPAGSYDSVSAAKQVEDKSSGIDQQSFGGQQFIGNHQGAKSDEASGTRNSGIYPKEMGQQQKRTTQDNIPDVPTSRDESASVPKTVEQKTPGIDQQSFGGQQFNNSHQGGKSDEPSGPRDSGIYPHQMEQQRRYATQHDVPTGRDKSVSAVKEVQDQSSAIKQQSFEGSKSDQTSIRDTKAVEDKSSGIQQQSGSVTQGVEQKSSNMQQQSILVAKAVEQKSSDMQQQSVFVTQGVEQKSSDMEQQSVFVAKKVEETSSDFEQKSVTVTKAVENKSSDMQQQSIFVAQGVQQKSSDIQQQGVSEFQTVADKSSDMQQQSVFVAQRVEQKSSDIQQQSVSEFQTVADKSSDMQQQSVFVAQGVEQKSSDFEQQSVTVSKVVEQKNSDMEQQTLQGLIL